MMLSAGQNIWGDTRLLSKVLLCLAVLLTHVSTEVEADFMGGLKAAFPGSCADHWTHRSWIPLPLHNAFSVCLYIRTQTLMRWTAFTYSPPHGQRRELGMQDDGQGLVVWLRGRRYPFPVHLTPRIWHHVCIAHNTDLMTLTLWVNNVSYTHEVSILTTVAPVGVLSLGCTVPSDYNAPLELYLFRMWNDSYYHGNCEDGSVVGWTSEEWLYHTWTAAADEDLPCDQLRVKRRALFPATHIFEVPAPSVRASRKKRSPTATPTTPSTHTSSATLSMSTITIQPTPPLTTTLTTSFQNNEDTSPLNTTTTNSPKITASFQEANLTLLSPLSTDPTHQLQSVTNSTVPPPSTTVRTSQPQSVANPTLQSPSTLPALQPQTGIISTLPPPSTIDPTRQPSSTVNSMQTPLSTPNSTAQPLTTINSPHPPSPITNSTLPPPPTMDPTRQPPSTVNSTHPLLSTTTSTIQSLPTTNSTLPPASTTISTLTTPPTMDPTRQPPSTVNSTQTPISTPNSTPQPLTTINSTHPSSPITNSTFPPPSTTISTLPPPSKIDPTRQPPSTVNSTQPPLSTPNSTPQSLSITNSTLPTSSTTNSTFPPPSTTSSTLPPPSTTNSTLPPPPTTNSTLPPPSTTNSTFPPPPTTNSTPPPSSSLQPPLSTSFPSTTFLLTNSSQTNATRTVLVSTANATQVSSMSNSTSLLTNTTLLPTTPSMLPSNTSATMLPSMSSFPSPTKLPSSTLSTLLSVSPTAWSPANISTSAVSLPSHPTPYDNYTGRVTFPCTFQDLCTHNSAYYSMSLNVTGTGFQNENDIKQELSLLFALYDCLPSDSTTVVPSLNYSSPAGTQLGSTLSEISTSGSVQGMCKANETIHWLLQKIDVSCTDETNIRVTQCSVLLHLNSSVDTCRLVQALQLQVNSSISATLLGNLERLGKGDCTSGNKRPSNGSSVRCSFSTQVSNLCQNTGFLNVTCDRYADEVYITLAESDPQTCTRNPSFQVQNSCVCSEFCKYTDAYYTFEINSIDYSKVHILKMIAELDSTLPICKSMATSQSLCLSARKVSSLYKNSSMNCPPGDQVSCRVILTLRQPVQNVCTVRDAMAFVFLQQNITFGNVSRAMACSPTLNFTENPMKNISAWESVNINKSLFCELGNKLTTMIKCLDRTVGVLLNEQCGTSSPAFPLPSVTPTALTGNSSMSPAMSVATATTTYNTTSLGSTTQLPVTATNTTVSTKPVGGVTTTAGGNTTGMTESLQMQADKLLNQTKDAAALNSSQVENLVSMLEVLVSGPNISRALGSAVIAAISNLLNGSVSALASSSNRIIRLADTVGIKLVISGQTETILSNSLALAVNKVNSLHFQEISFTIQDPSNVQITPGTKVQRSTGSQVPQGTIVLPASLTSSLSPLQQQQVSRVQFNFYQKSTVFVDKALGIRILNSGILGSSVANLSISGLTDNVTFSLRNNRPVPANYTPLCVFWDFSENNGTGGWNKSGCSMQNYSHEQTSCTCNHLTSFAVLLDISGQFQTDPLQNEILTYISNIGCGISAIFLSITLLTYVSFEKLRRDIPSKILIQLCLALLLLNLVFLLDSWLALYTKAEGLCISTAFFLHYFLLASFTWMALEAFHMYLALVKVFNTYVTRYMLKFCLVGWGVPLVVVIIVIAIKKGSNYGLVSYGHFPDGSTDDFCWIKDDVVFYVSVVAYFCLMFLLNTTMFVVVLIQLCRIKHRNPHNIQHRSVMQDVRSVTGLAILLGLTWGFAFFAWGPVNLAFMYLFSIFNSLQGLFIFVFHCAIKENVRRQWRTYLCCGKLRLSENSEWSRTATQNKTAVGRSRTLVASSRSSNSTESNNTTSSSFLSNEPAEQTNGIGNPYEDRTITAQEESHADVVLNEIHSRHKLQRDH